nr:ABC transporter permease [Pseudomonas fluorescens]
MSGAGQTFHDLLHDVSTNLRTLGRRAVLTLLGVVMGSCSVVALINIGHNAAEEAAAIFQGMGVDTVVAQISNDAEITHAGPLTVEIAHLRRKVPELEDIAPVALMGNSVMFRGRDLTIELIGTTAPLKQALGLEMRKGRFLSAFDYKATHAVIGHQLADELSGAGEPVRIGDTLRVRHVLFQVIGILHPKFPSAIAPFNTNTSLFIPLEGISRLQAWTPVTHVFARAPGASPIDSVVSDFEHALSPLFPGQAIDVLVPQQIIDGLSQQNRTFTYLLAALASISLLASGIGVMNVMLMNISQRRREIGLRMAMGARPRDIRNLFMIEALTVTTLGALTGAILGVGLALLYARVSGWSFVLSPTSVPLGVCSAIAVGVFFGLYPALSASRLQPVEALREDD